MPGMHILITFRGPSRTPQKSSTMTLASAYGTARVGWLMTTRRLRGVY